MSDNSPFQFLQHLDKFSIFQNFFFVGNRMTLGSDAGSLRHPQRRMEDFTNPSATAEVHFLQWPGRSILSRIFEIFSAASAIERISSQMRDRSTVRNSGTSEIIPQRSEVNSVNPSATVGRETSPIHLQWRTLTLPVPPQRRNSTSSSGPIVQHLSDFSEFVAPGCSAGHRG